MKGKYDSDDEVTFYFVIYSDGSIKDIRGWTDDKELAKAYMDFHKCKRFKLKSITGEYGKVIVPILNESVNDEIQLINIFIRSQKDKCKYEQVTVPLTSTEGIFINSEETSFFGSRINYVTLNGMTPFLKNRWKRALNAIHLEDVINQSVHNRSSRFTMNIKLDQLMILVKSFPDYFGI